MCITHKGTVTLETERLFLRPFNQEDAKYVFKYASDAETVRFLRFHPHESIECSEMIVNQWVNNYKNTNFYTWCIVCKACKEPVGSIAIVDINEYHRQGELGYVLRKDHWSNGLMTEACQRVVRFCFEECNFQRVESCYCQENIQSERVLEKSGMQFEGVKREYFPTDHGFTDCNMYAITRSRFEVVYHSSHVC